jgi:uncharacterized DUF497 family protein
VPGYRFEFEWDQEKALSNLKKHGLSFREASTVFLDPLATTIVDHDHSEREWRWATLGLSRIGILLVVIHTYRELVGASAAIRIISARRATPSEMRDYEEGTYEA